MPLRTIKCAFINYRDSEGRMVEARRGETHDIPEGEDLDRGDKWDAFTDTVGQEPALPEGVSLPEIVPDWSDEEYIRFVDAGPVNEILTKYGEVDPSRQAEVARRLVDAEQGRKSGARAELLTSLTFAGQPGVSTVETSDVTPEDEDSETGTPPSEDDEDGPSEDPDRPAGNASTEEWRAYGVQRGLTEDEAAQLSRSELIERFPEAYHAVPQFDWEPNPDDVGSILHARTVDTNGDELGTFTPDTRPTGDQVTDLIESACAELDAAAGKVPERLFVSARRVAAIGTALLVELGYFPDQINTGQSPYAQLEARYEKLLSQLIVSIEDVQSGGEPGEGDTLAQFYFGDDRCPLGFSTRW